MKAAADAKKAMLEKFKPKPTVIDPDFDQREALRLAELEKVRLARAEAKAQAKARQEEAAAARRAAEAELAQTELEIKRLERKERKQTQKEIMRAKKERLGAYKNTARRGPDAPPAVGVGKGLRTSRTKPSTPRGLHPAPGLPRVAPPLMWLSFRVHDATVPEASWNRMSARPSPLRSVRPAKVQLP